MCACVRAQECHCLAPAPRVQVEVRDASIELLTKVIEVSLRRDSHTRDSLCVYLRTFSLTQTEREREREREAHTHTHIHTHIDKHLMSHSTCDVVLFSSGTTASSRTYKLGSGAAERSSKYHAQARRGEGKGGKKGVCG